MLDLADSVVAELLQRARTTRLPASELMRDAFRTRKLRPRQQKRVKDLFHGALAHERLIDLAFERATPAGGVAPQFAAPLRVLVSRVLTGDLSPKAAAARLPWVDWARVAVLPDEARAIGDPVARIALRGSLPDWLAGRLRAQYGDAAEALAVALCGRAPVVVRANALKGSREDLAARLAAEGVVTRPGVFATHALEVVAPAQLFRTEAYRQGRFEMQDEASQLVVEITAPPPGGLVVDTCAGAGGKSLGLAAMLDNRGTVVGLDVDQRRLGDLKQRARRAGAHNVRAIGVPPDAWPGDVEDFVRKADRVLIDAPCSGLGSLRRNPEMRWRTDRAELERLRAIQADLLARAAVLLRPRARIVYATCTMLAEENERIVDAALERFPELERVSIVEILGGERGRPITDPTGHYLRMLPHVHGTDGFFCAVLRRKLEA